VSYRIVRKALPRVRRWLIAASTVAACAVGLTTVVRGIRPGAAAPEAPETAPAGVACLGRIEPDEGVIVLAARSLTGQPSIVARVLVAEGDAVRSGQIVAILNSQPQLEAALREAASHVGLAKARLAQVESGAHPGDVLAEEAEIGRLESERANAEAEFRRFASLYEGGVASITDTDLRRTRLETATQLVLAAKARLRSLTEVRTTDVDAARAAVAAAVAAEQRARAELEPASVRAPADGTVLKVHARAGEEVGVEGILELGRTDRMYVIAEVPESDVARVKRGDVVTIMGDALQESMQGAVEQIGARVMQSRILNTDPASFVDARIVEVKIRLHDSGRAAGLIHARVRVVTRS